MAVNSSVRILGNGHRFCLWRNIRIPVQPLRIKSPPKMIMIIGTAFKTFILKA
jgi:hypothetical protein